jgi:hypothetical protein
MSSNAITQQLCGTTPGQGWTVIGSAGGPLQITNLDTGLCMNISSFGNGAPGEMDVVHQEQRLKARLFHCSRQFDNANVPVRRERLDANVHVPTVRPVGSFPSRSPESTSHRP